MRLACTSALLCLSFALFAQEQKSLLWEITGNGLEESSYLYGTMHVSKKIAFRLDDVFFEALEASDIIALESDPETWLDSEIHRGADGYGFGYGFDTKGFYREAFVLEPPEDKDLASYLAFDDRLINNILYRTNEYAQNFEEETYLDMFIYQAGAKYGKPVVALENLEESSTLVARASMNAMKRKPDEWLQKKMQGQDINYLMQDAYRERNIDLLDSIDKAMYTDYYRKNMLYIRNANMTESLDSVMHSGKVFAGIGAAHLPGEQGVLQLLRKKGYTVEPLLSEATQKGRMLKQKFENKIRNTNYKKYGPEDGSFQLLLPSELYPVSESKNTVYISPDLANGSYLMVNRIPTYALLKTEGRYSIDKINALLFENIPGEIVHQSKLEKNGIRGLDITNKLKNGDYQRYQIYIRPLEIIIFKMAGKGDQVLQFSDRIFDSLKFKDASLEKVVLHSTYMDFKIEMPAEHTFGNPSRIGHRMLEGYEHQSGSYFFLKRASIIDLKSIEEDSFELYQIQKRFYQDLGLDGEFESVSNNSLRSQAVYDHAEGRILYMMGTFKRGDYYLLGCLTDDAGKAEEFLNSFELKEEFYPEEFEQIKDTAMLFTTISTVKPKKFVENSNGYFRRHSKIKSYNPFTKKTQYQNKNNETVTVELNKSHDLLSFPSIDSLWALRLRQYTKKDFRLIREKRSKHKDLYELEFIATDTLSSRGILVKNVVKDGLLYELKTVVDTVEEPSRFVSEFYDNFQPMDTVIGRSFIRDKSAEFFEALRNGDSIVLKGYRFPYYNESHIDSLKYYISEFKYENDTRHIQSYLIQKLGALNEDEIWDFFISYYQLCYGNSLAQVKILQALTKREDMESTELLKQLLAKDLPLVSNHKEITKVFMPYRENLSLARSLYPEVLEYSNVLEYKIEIISLLADLKSEGLIKSSQYKKYVRSMLSDARIQLKRQLSRQGHYQMQRSSQQLTQKQNKELLEDYAILLFPFRKDKEVTHFFNRLMAVKSPIVRTTVAALMAVKDEHGPLVFIDSLAGDINSRALIFDRLEDIDKLYLYPSLYHVQEALAESAIFEDRNYIGSKDEVVYLGEKQLDYQAKSYTGYFFKLRSRQDFDKNYRMFMVVYDSCAPVTTEYFYKSDGYRMADMDTDETAMDYVVEEFQLKDRSRAMVYHPRSSLTYSQLGF